MRRISLSFACGMALLWFGLAACGLPRPPAPEARTPVLRTVQPDASRLHDDGTFAGLADAVRNSIAYYRKLPADTPYSFGDDRATAGELLATLTEFLAIIEDPTLTAEQKEQRIAGSFRFYQSAGSDSAGGMLFTGYYLPTLDCRLAADDSHAHPIYRKPDDLIEVSLSDFGLSVTPNRLLARLDGRKAVPYYTRHEIDANHVLANSGLELLWCSDRFDVFSLQVQGSGVADLGNGARKSILYDGQNGRPYRSIGRQLVESGAIPRDKVTMQSIRQYLRDHPDQADAIMDSNPAYVFFRVGNGPALGTIGVPITAGRTIATDSTLFPKGALALISTWKPVFRDGAIVSWETFSRFVVNQDTGGAIKGAGRTDLFCGGGKEAELTAGGMQHPGQLYFLLRKRTS